jgi:hypothetical protein
MKEKDVVVVNPSHRMMSGLGLMAIGLILTQMWFQRDMTLKTDFAMLLIMMFFFTTSLYTMFSWSKIRFYTDQTNAEQDTYHFGIIKVTKKLSFTEVYYVQVPQLIPTFRVCLRLIEGEGNDIIVKEGMKKSEAEQVYKKISLLCGIPIPEPEPEPAPKDPEEDDDEDEDFE